MLQPSDILLTPFPRSVAIKSGYSEFGTGPFVVNGVESAVLAAVNKCCRNLAAMNPQDSAQNVADFLRDRRALSLPASSGNELFVPYQSTGSAGRKGQPPEISVRLAKGFTPRFPSKKQYNYGKKEIRSETYRLAVQDGSNPKTSEQPKIIIDAESGNGVRYALFTLVQLFRQFGRRIPSMTVEDAPAFPTRGFMLDISRDRVPLQSELLKLVDLLASLKYNHLQLYTEHTFAYEGHETVWENSSPMTADEIRELDKYCQDRGVALAANQNCFGHMHRWLKHEKYAHLAETTGEWNFNGTPRTGPFSLCPVDPGSIELVEDLLGQALPNFSSGLANVGCDETFDVGQGRSKEIVEVKGKFPVYWEYVEKVINIARRQNFRPIIWADMLLSEMPDGFKLPAGVIPLVWGYEPDTPFKKWCERLNANARDVWVCPGTSSWRSITGRSYERTSNLTFASKEGVESGANGYLVTEWGDLGHRQQFPLTLFGLAEGAHFAWNTNDIESEGAFSLHVFGDWSLDAELSLSDIGDFDLHLRLGRHSLDIFDNESVKNSTHLFNDLESPWEDIKTVEKPLFWEEIKDEIEEIERNNFHFADEQLESELMHILKTTRFAVERGIIRRQHYTPPDEERQRLKEMISEIIEEHRDLWLKRSRPGGLEDSCNYYERVLHELE